MPLILLYNIVICFEITMKNKKYFWHFGLGIITIAVVLAVVFGNQVGDLFQGKLFNNLRVQDIKPNEPFDFRQDVVKNRKNLKLRYGLCYDADCENKAPNYVIITRPIFIDALQNFIQWKQNNGFQVGVMTVDYIDSQYSGNNNAEKIKKFITKHSTHTNYFLLVGDTEVWKYSHEFKYNVSSNADIQSNLEGAYDLTKPWNVPSGYVVLGEQKGMMLSDLYYADLDNWDKNNDGILDTQPYSEIFSFETMVGRWPVRTPEELNNVIDKTMSVKVSNMMDYWGSEEWRELYTQKDIDEKCMNVPKNFLDQGSVITECIMHLIFGYDDNTSFTVNYVTKADIAGGNLNFVNYFINTSWPIFANFHGSTYGIEGFTIDDIGKFSKVIPLFVPRACSMIHYYLRTVDAFSEALVKAKKGPATLVVPPNDYYFFQQLAKGKTIGEAFYPKENKWMLNRWYSTLLGDPSLKIFN